MNTNEYSNRFVGVNKTMLSDERCEECNSELSPCGSPSVDGEPSMDCKVCQLREQLSEAKRDSERLDWLLDKFASSFVALSVDGMTIHQAIDEAINGGK